jgi:hypothetical protein
MNDDNLFIPRLCEHLLPIERETHNVLGKRASFFIDVWDDCMSICDAISSAYPDQHGNLLHHYFHGLIKELYWFHFYFVSGNYTIISARMRFCWEAIYRAYYAERYAGVNPPGPSPDDKLRWLEQKRPNWNELRQILHALFPLAARENDVAAFYDALWKNLHRFVHPSEEVTLRSIDETALHVRDGFDERWALDTIETGLHVFDVIWVAVLSFYPLAAARIAHPSLRVKYVIVTDALRRMHESDQSVFVGRL